MEAKTDVARPLLTEDVSVAEAIVQVLEECGIDVVFGMPGGLTMSLFDALYDHKSTVRCVLVREESIATIMAEVYGRLSGRPGVAIGQGAFILGNGSTGTLEALLSGSPMILLTDLSDGGDYAHHAPYQAGTGDYGTWNAREGFSGVTKIVMAPASGVQAVQSTQLAIKHSLSGQPGPAAVLFSSRALRDRVGPDSAPRLYSTAAYLPDDPSPADPIRVREVAQLLADAERPVIAAGGGVATSRAFTELARLVDMAGIPVATTAKGKGSLPETHELALGVFGNFGLPVANALVAEADVILAIGTKMAPSDTGNAASALLDPSRQKLIQLDIEPRNAAWTFPVTHSLIGDARIVMKQLCAEFESSLLLSNGRLNRRKAHVRAAKEEHGYFDNEATATDLVPMRPQVAILALQKALPSNAIVTCDAGENRIFMAHFFQTRAAGTHIQPAGIGGMGYAIPAALGAKILYPTTPVVAVCGDGGFGMAINGLLTSIEERIPIIVFILNNSLLGWVKHEQGSRVVAADLEDFDYAAIARAMGCQGARVSNPGDLPAVLGKAIDSDVTTVIDVVTSPDETFRAILASFVTATADQV